MNVLQLFRMLQADHVQTRLAALREAIDTSTAKACHWLEEEKKKAALKRIFVQETDVSSWEEAQEKYPVASKKVTTFQGSTNSYMIPFTDKDFTDCATCVGKNV